MYSHKAQADNSKADEPALQEFIIAHFKDPECKHIFTSERKDSPLFTMDYDKYWNDMLFSASLRARFVHLCSFSILAGHPVEGYLHDPMRKNLYWSHMDNDVYTIVFNYRSYTQNTTYAKRQRQLKLCFSD